MTDCTMAREREGDRVVYRLGGVFDRASAWGLREKMERETAREVLLDFSLVRDFSDLGVAVVAHGLNGATRRVLFRGLRQHQLRIFRYCGIAVEELSAREAVITAPAAPHAGEDRL
ncbi:MAG TPA: STAS domain-containing protein [Anaeromyxobacteraceae bacterium]